MLFLTILKVAMKSLFSNKMRSFLAMLGIIIGVGAVISMLSMGAGAQQQVMDQISAMGTDLMIVRPERRGGKGVVSDVRVELTVEDARAVFDAVPSVKKGAPVVESMAQLKYFNNNTRSNVTGTAATYPSIRNFEVEKGRMFTEGEVERNARVAVLGPTTVENLFEDQDPLGEAIKIKGMNFTVIGVLKSKGDQGWYNPDDQAIVPYTVAMNQLFGMQHLREIDLQLFPETDHEQAKEEISGVLRKRHRIRTDSEDDFELRSQAEIMETAIDMTRTFTVLLAGIASISLLVGGIGIMNIMLVTVTERTREIGIRKAVGAKERDILRQFIIEAIIMSGIGGIIGVGMGVGAGEIISRVTEFAVVTNLSAVLLALSFSAGVGIFFGYYPARCAARMNPIEALRYE